MDITKYFKRGMYDDFVSGNSELLGAGKDNIKYLNNIER